MKLPKLTDTQNTNNPDRFSQKVYVSGHSKQSVRFFDITITDMPEGIHAYLRRRQFFDGWWLVVDKSRYL